MTEYSSHAPNASHAPPIWAYRASSALQGLPGLSGRACGSQRAYPQRAAASQLARPKTQPFLTPVPASNFSPQCHARRSPGHRRRRVLAASAATRPATKPCASSQRPVSRWAASMSVAPRSAADAPRCPAAVAAACGPWARSRPAARCRRRTTAAMGWARRCTSGSRTSWRRRSSAARGRTRRWCDGRRPTLP